MANALRAITAHAKKIYKRGGTWRGAIKKAGVAYRKKHKGKKVGAHRKKKVHRARRVGSVKRSATVRRVKRLHRAEGRAIKSLGSIASTKARLRRQLQEQIGYGEMMKFSAKKKSSKRKIGHRINKYKAEYRRLL